MKWVKASERLPEKKGEFLPVKIIGKVFRTGCLSYDDETPFIFIKDHFPESWFDLNTIEWLDETPSKEAEKGDEVPDFAKSTEGDYIFNMKNWRIIYSGDIAIIRRQALPQPPKE